MRRWALLILSGAAVACSPPDGTLLFRVVDPAGRPTPARDGYGMGDEVVLESPRDVRIRGSVRFDPARDDVRELELVRNGEPVALATRRSAPGRIALEVSQPVRRPGWFALRASGEKIGETRMETPWLLTPRSLEVGCAFGCGASLFERAEFVGAGRARPAAAHSAPIYVGIAGARPEPPAETVGRTLARLDALEARLADERLDELVVLRPFASRLLIDGVPADALRRDRPALRAAIDAARRHYLELGGRSSFGTSPEGRSSDSTTSP